MENLIQLSDYYEGWSMELDLEEIANSFGVKNYEEYYDPETNKTKRSYYTLLPLKNAKRMIDLIIRYGSDEDCEKADDYFRKNAKLYRYWKEKYDERP